MKKKIPFLRRPATGKLTFHYLFSLICIILVFSHTNAQQVFDESSVHCGGVKTFPGGPIATPKALTCTPTAGSTAYHTKYKRQSFYKPTANDPVITIKITFHVFNKSDGTGSWPNTPTGINDLTTIASWMHDFNERYSPPRNANYTGPGFVSPHTPDSRVNYELTNIYFYNNDGLNATTNGVSLVSHINSIDPSRMQEGLPIFFNNGVWVGVAGYQGAYNSNDVFVHSFIGPLSSGYWAQEHLRHEIGHALGFGHTYQGGGDEVQFGHPCSDFDFLEDVFPINNGCTTTLGCGACWEDAVRYSNNFMNGRTGDCYWMSPLQMGRRRRNMYLNAPDGMMPSGRHVRKFAKEMTSSVTAAWQITSNETWDFDIQMYQDIIVKPGATLTVKCKIGMANEGRIIVERGAKLVIDGGEIYAWGHNWAGIQVWGTSNMQQTIVSGYSTHHGIVQIVNQGTVRDAFNGITTIKYDEFGNWDWGGYTGGIIQCDGAQFINNQRAIQYLSYHNFNPVNGNTIDNIGYIRRSLFQTNNALKNGNDPEVFISMWAVDGIKLYGNIYQNTRTPLPAIDSRGDGIHSEDASYYVDRYKVCSLVDMNGNCVAYSVNVPSTFQNLHYGVHAQNSTPLTYVRVNDNDFSGCNRSVYFGGTYYTIVTNNRINVGNGLNNPQYLPYGIYSESSSAYDISNNTIYSTQWTNYNLSLGTGICISETNGLNNLLYRNTINMMGAGTTVYGDNQGTNPGDGLQLKCNIYGQGANGKNFIDINMGFRMYPTIWMNGKIDTYQGSSTSGANNIFSHTNNPSPAFRTDYFDGPQGPGPAGSIHYFYNVATGQLTEPFYYSNSLAPTSIATPYNATTMCPPVISGGGSSIVVNDSKPMARTLSMLSSYHKKITDMLVQIDGNHRQELLGEIQGNVPNEQLKKDLLSAGPYLSDEVLGAYLQRSRVPYTDIQEVIVANSPVSDAIQQMLEDMRLPENIREHIRLAQTGTSKRVQLYATIADLNREKAYMMDEAIRKMMSDTVTGWNKNDLWTLISQDSRHGALEPVFRSGEFSRIQELLAELEQESGKLSLQGNDRNITCKAQLLLKEVMKYKNYEFINLPNTSDTDTEDRFFHMDETTGEPVEMNGSSIIFPNPSHGIFVLQLTDDITGPIDIFNAMGSNVTTINRYENNSRYEIDLTGYPSGVYMVQFISNGQRITKKIILQ